MSNGKKLGAFCLTPEPKRKNESASRRSEDSVFGTQRQKHVRLKRIIRDPSRQLMLGDQVDLGILRITSDEL
jgi:hypothetical protein